MEAQVKRLEAWIEKIQEMLNKDPEELNNKQSPMTNTINEIKNSLEVTNSRIIKAEEWISELEWWKKLKQSRITKKRIKWNEDNLRDFWDNIKCTSVQIIGISEEEINKWYEKIYEEIILKNFPNMGKEIATQV